MHNTCTYQHDVLEWQLHLSRLPHEKINNLHMRKHRRRSASRADRGNREADQRLCFRYTDSTLPLLPESEISSF